MSCKKITNYFDLSTTFQREILSGISSSFTVNKMSYTTTQFTCVRKSFNRF